MQKAVPNENIAGMTRYCWLIGGVLDRDIVQDEWPSERLRRHFLR